MRSLLCCYLKQEQRELLDFITLPLETYGLIYYLCGHGRASDEAERPHLPDLFSCRTLLPAIRASKYWTLTCANYDPQILDGASSPADFNATENTFVLPMNSVVELQFPPTFVSFYTCVSLGTCC